MKNQKFRIITDKGIQCNEICPGSETKERSCLDLCPAISANIFEGWKLQISVHNGNIVKIDRSVNGLWIDLSGIKLSKESVATVQTLMVQLEFTKPVTIGQAIKDDQSIIFDRVYFVVLLEDPEISCFKVRQRLTYLRQTVDWNIAQKQLKDVTSIECNSVVKIGETHGEQLFWELNKRYRLSAATARILFITFGCWLELSKQIQYWSDPVQKLVDLSNIEPYTARLMVNWLQGENKLLGERSNQHDRCYCEETEYIRSKQWKKYYPWNRAGFLPFKEDK